MLVNVTQPDFGVAKWAHNFNRAPESLHIDVMYSTACYKNSTRKHSSVSSRTGNNIGIANKSTPSVIARNVIIRPKLFLSAINTSQRIRKSVTVISIFLTIAVVVINKCYRYNVCNYCNKSANALHRMLCISRHLVLLFAGHNARKGRTVGIIVIIIHWVMRCWRDSLSATMCKWFAYGTAATPSSFASLKSIFA